jgi:hypothetical protein
MLETPRCVLLHVTSRKSREPSFLLRDQSFTMSHSNTRRWTKRGAGRGDVSRRKRPSLLLHIRVSRFLRFSNSRMGRLSHNIYNIHCCCSHLEHMASVKRLVSLHSLNFRQSLELLGRRISRTQGRYLHRATQTQTSIPPCLEWDSNTLSKCSSG